MSKSAAQLLRAGTQKLDDAGVLPPRLDASIMLAHVMGIERQELLLQPELEVTEDQELAFEAYVEQRLKRMPISHILGEREFWSLPFKVTAHTLAPRPDSETLIEAALDYLEERFEEQTVPAEGLRILDLGTGTGCLLLSLLAEWDAATGVGVDISPETVAVAKENAAALGLGHRVEIICADFMADLTFGKEFDIILCNPPYIATKDRESLDPEVRDYEPDIALYGGEDGLSYYRELAPVLAQCLKENGAVFLEVGMGQSGPVMGMMSRAGARNISYHQDLAMIDRCLSFTF